MLQYEMDAINDELDENSEHNENERGIEVLQKRVLNLCNKNWITVYQLEKRLGWANGTIKRMKTSMPSAYKVYQLAEFFDTSCDYLLGISNQRRRINEELIDGINMMNKEQRAFIEGCIRGFMLGSDDIELDTIDKVSHLEQQKKYIKGRIEILQEELKILEAKDKREMAIEVRGYKK